MKKCSVESCHNDSKITGFCKKHYMQKYHTGVIKDRFRNDKNEYIIHSDYVEILLYDKRDKVHAKSLIDIDDVDKCKKYKWSLHSQGYAHNGHVGMLHNYITNHKGREVIIDHEDHNRLNNKKSNLRIADYAQNTINRSKPCAINTSGVTGVSFSKKQRKWHAYIAVDKKRINLGYLNDFELAKQIRLDAEIKYYGEYSPFKNEQEEVV